MINAVLIARALVALRPELIALVKTLLERFEGDVPSVARELRRIVDHGIRGEEAELGFRARVDAARAARAQPAAPVPAPDDEDDDEDVPGAPTSTTRREPS